MEHCYGGCLNKKFLLLLWCFITFFDCNAEEQSTSINSRLNNDKIDILCEDAKNTRFVNNVTMFTMFVSSLTPIVAIASESPAIFISGYTVMHLSGIVASVNTSRLVKKQNELGDRAYFDAWRNYKKTLIFTGATALFALGLPSENETNEIIFGTLAGLSFISSYICLYASVVSPRSYSGEAIERYEELKRYNISLLPTFDYQENKLGLNLNVSYNF